MVPALADAVALPEFFDANDELAPEYISPRTFRTPAAAISQTHLPRVDNWLISQVLALCDGGGGFAGGKKRQGGLRWGLLTGKSEGSAGRP